MVSEAPRMGMCVSKQGLRYHWPIIRFFFFILSASLAMALREDASKWAGLSAQRGAGGGGRCGGAESDARTETHRHRAARICSRGAGMHTKCCAHEEWQEPACEQTAERTACRSVERSPARTEGPAYRGAHLQKNKNHPAGAPIRFNCAWILRSACGSRVTPGGVDDRACRQSEHLFCVSSHPLGTSVRMALTICTRFTDEYQLFEELGK